MSWLKLSLFALLALSSSAWAADEMNAADVSWMMVATTLVLFMTIPGIALFYAGMVRKRMSSPLLCKVLLFAVR